MASNPWEKLKQHASELVAPIAVLREQAQLLSQATDGLIQGAVDSETSGKYVTVALTAYVPAMNNYSIVLLTVRHDVLLYPATVISPWADTPNRRCNSKQELEEAVVAALSDDAIQKIVASLLAQATGDT